MEVISWIGAAVIFIPLTGIILLLVALKRKKKEEGR